MSRHRSDSDILSGLFKLALGIELGLEREESLEREDISIVMYDGKEGIEVEDGKEGVEVEDGKDGIEVEEFNESPCRIEELDWIGIKTSMLI